MNKINIGILGSTKGTDLQAVIDEIEAGRLDANIPVVVSNKEDAYILERARKHSIKALFIEPKDKTREEFDKEVIDIFEKENVGLVLLIGYMRLLSKPFVDKYMNKIMNIHPSLLPAFEGGMDKSVHKSILEQGVNVTGCTLHFVDEGADTGPIILQEPVMIEDGETVESLKPRVQKAEQEIIIKAIKLFSEGKLKVEGRKVKIID
tara:strand:+ start:827 stop:1444 length:618 start_codon:yes stop_codon:yes gene_type:complete